MSNFNKGLGRIVRIHYMCNTPTKCKITKAAQYHWPEVHQHCQLRCNGCQACCTLASLPAKCWLQHLMPVQFVQIVPAMVPRLQQPNQGNEPLAIVIMMLTATLSSTIVVVTIYMYNKHIVMMMLTGTPSLAIVMTTATIYIYKHDTIVMMVMMTATRSSWPHLMQGALQWVYAFLGLRVLGGGSSQRHEGTWQWDITPDGQTPPARWRCPRPPLGPDQPGAAALGLAQGCRRAAPSPALSPACGTAPPASGSSLLTPASSSAPCQHWHCRQAPPPSVRYKKDFTTPFCLAKASPNPPPLPCHPQTLSHMSTRFHHPSA